MAKEPSSITVAAVQPPKPLFCEPFAPDTDRPAVAAKARRNLQRVAELIERAAERGADVVCTPEDVTGACRTLWSDEDGTLFRDLVRDTSPEAIEQLGAIARKREIHVVACLFLEEAGRIYNCGVLIGRDGKVEGIYRKTHLPAAERHRVATGDSYPVFETDFGRVGMLICYDLHFPEPARCLALNGADTLFHPTIGMSFGGPGLMIDRVKVRAFDNAVWIVAAHHAAQDGRGKGWCGSSMIVSPLGEIVAEAGTAKDAVVLATIDPQGGRDLEADYSASGVLDWRRRMQAERRTETYGVFADAQPPIRRIGGEVEFLPANEIAEMNRQEAAKGTFKYCREDW